MINTTRSPGWTPSANEAGGLPPCLLNEFAEGHRGDVIIAPVHGYERAIRRCRHQRLG
jgi:hypothetical protein